jgi:transposase
VAEARRRCGDPEKKPKEKNPDHGPRPQPNLPIVEKVFDLDDADKICAACGGGFQIVPGGRYSNSFAIECATMKYVDQLPFDRIARIFGREGLHIEAQTISRNSSSTTATSRSASSR